MIHQSTPASVSGRMHLIHACNKWKPRAAPATVLNRLIFSPESTTARIQRRGEAREELLDRVAGGWTGVCCVWTTGVAAMRVLACGVYVAKTRKSPVCGGFPPPLSRISPPSSLYLPLTRHSRQFRFDRRTTGTGRNETNESERSTTHSSSQQPRQYHTATFDILPVAYFIKP